METQTQEKLKIHIETWGCQMNVADSEKMLTMMKLENYQWVPEAQGADLIILNTCHIREKAKHKVMSRLGVLKQYKDNNPELMIAVAGCVAQAEGKKLLEQSEAIDVLLGPGKIKELPRLVSEFKNSKKRQVATGFEKPKTDLASMEVEEDFPITPVPLDGKNEVSRYVNIQQGCDNFCTFCVVPFTRGREISEKPINIIKQVQGFIDRGAKEVTVLGQNVNSYGLDLVEKGLLSSSEDGPFVDLLKELAKISGLSRLRFTTSNPHDFTKALADLFHTEPKLGKYIHLPVQSGSDRILSVMKRKVTEEEYLERIQWLRSAVPDMSISTDLIVGFPGETDEDFEKTYELVKKVQFSFVYAFSYSPRKGTAAARFAEQVPDAVKSERLARINALQDAITLSQHKDEIGKIRRVLFHYKTRKEENVYYGKSEHFRLVRVPSMRNLLGMEIDIKIIDANKTALTGTLDF